MPPSASTPPSPLLVRLTRHWSMAILIGLSVTATIVHVQPFASSTLSALLAIAIGWVLTLVFAPWHAMVVAGRDREATADLARAVRQATADGRDRPLHQLRLDRDDELGELSRAVHDALVQATSERRQSRHLQRTMDDSIRRETHRATARLRREAATDPLTGLGNRRNLDERLDELFAGEDRSRSDTVVAIMFDMDNFKDVNDTLGHETGDECLAFLGKLLRSTLRHDDCAVRLGGDEFVVLMPNLEMSEARTAAERISALFNQMTWPHEAVPRPTLSVGVARARAGDPHGRDDLLPRADAALYAAKNRGRNRVVTSDELHPAPKRSEGAPLRFG